MRRLTVAIAALLASCTSTPSAIATSSPVPSMTATPAAVPTSARTATPEPSLTRGTAPLPALAPDPRFQDLQITLTGDDPTGMVGEVTPFNVTRAPVDAAYLARVTRTLGVSGPGTPGVGPDGSAPWRLWLGRSVLAVNERTGDVIFFDPAARDDPAATTGAVDQPREHMSLVASLTPGVDFVGATLLSFVSSDSAAATRYVMDGSWAPPTASRTSVVYPMYHTPGGYNGTRFYDADDVAVLTPGGRPAELIHRPVAKLDAGPVYPMTLYRDAVHELLAAPNRYLRYLSVAPSDPVALRVDPARTTVGHAWAGGPPGALTRLGQTLVPVWVFYATGGTRSGVSVDAVFIVDAVAPEFRAPPASATRNITADDLLRRQLSVSVGGHQPWMLGAEGVLQDELARGPCAAGTYSLSSNDADARVASVTCPNGAHLTMTIRRAFPGLAGSIWYIAETRK